MGLNLPESDIVRKHPNSEREVTRARAADKAEPRLADARLAKAEAARTRIEVANRNVKVARTLVAKAAKALDLAETGYD